MIARLKVAARRGLGRRDIEDPLYCAPAVSALVRGRHGLEIGGPTRLFRRDGVLPIYAAAAALDNVNFSSQTLWEGRIEAGDTFQYDPQKPAGRQFIADASALPSIGDATYDFVAASHVLEHTADPLAMLREWLRVTRPGGALILVVPHKDGTFDHHRPVTTLEHLVDDERSKTGEDDLTHLPEILALHDLSLDAPAGTPEEFRARCARNLENRAMHHHVFDTALAVALVDYVGMQIRQVEAALAHHIFVIAEKTASAVDNAVFLGSRAAYRSASPFSSDRV